MKQNRKTLAGLLTGAVVVLGLLWGTPLARFLSPQPKNQPMKDAIKKDTLKQRIDTMRTNPYRDFIKMKIDSTQADRMPKQDIKIQAGKKPVTLSQK